MKAQKTVSVRSYSRARARDATVAWRVMALSKLSGDEQGIILGQLRNSLEPRLAMYFSSASTELRALLTPALRQPRDHPSAAAAPPASEAAAARCWRC